MARGGRVSLPPLASPLLLFSFPSPLGGSFLTSDKVKRKGPVVRRSTWSVILLSPSAACRRRRFRFLEFVGVFAEHPKGTRSREGNLRGRRQRVGPGQDDGARQARPRPFRTCSGECATFFDSSCAFDEDPDHFHVGNCVLDVTSSTLRRVRCAASETLACRLAGDQGGVGVAFFLNRCT